MTREDTSIRKLIHLYGCWGQGGEGRGLERRGGEKEQGQKEKTPSQNIWALVIHSPHTVNIEQ